MVREICKDEAFLAQKAEPATADDLVVAQDLLDTLVAHRDRSAILAFWVMVSSFQRLDTGSRWEVWRRKSGKNRSYRSLSVGFRAKQGAAFFNRRLAAALRAARSLRVSPVTR